MSHSVVLIPGEGIGPEVTDAARRVVDATGVAIDWRVCEAGMEAYHRTGEPLPEETVDAIRECKTALKGPITTPSGKGFRSVNVRLRQTLDLYANFRPARSIAGLPAKYGDVDLIVIRENTEGLYSGLEHEVVPGVVESLRVITRAASERVVRFAFETAVRRGRRKVTAVHKANILKMSDGLFLDVARQVAQGYPSIEYDECIVDAAAMKLVINPRGFDVLVMENLFGDILSDLASGLIGGLGLTGSANLGDEIALFEAVHGTAPDIADQGVANPTALILSAALLLRRLGEESAAERMEAAVHHALADEKTRTGDLGGKASTVEFTETVIAAM